MKNQSTEEKRCQLNQLENNINYKFYNLDYLNQALTHTSYANENKKQKIKHYERMEFLGDAILEMVSSEFFFNKFTDLEEGKLTKLRASYVCEKSLAYCARSIKLDEYILLGKGEEKTGGRNKDSILSDVCESLIGAIYLDGGFTNAKEFILKYILYYLEDKDLFYDSKTILQEIVQKNKNDVICYEVIKEEGFDHNKIFTSEVRINNKVIGIGSGRTKKLAEQEAAKKGLLYYL